MGQEDWNGDVEVDVDTQAGDTRDFNHPDRIRERQENHDRLVRDAQQKKLPNVSHEEILDLKKFKTLSKPESEPSCSKDSDDDFVLASEEEPVKSKKISMVEFLATKQRNFDDETVWLEDGIPYAVDTSAVDRLLPSLSDQILIASNFVMDPEYLDMDEEAEEMRKDDWNSRLKCMSDHPMIRELHGFKFVVKKTIGGKEYTHATKVADAFAADPTLLKPEIFYSRIKYLSALPKNAQALNRFLQHKVLCVSCQGDRMYFEGIYAGNLKFYIGGFEEDPTWWQSVAEKMKDVISDWMNYSTLFRTGNWLAKLTALGWSPLTRLLLGVASLMGYNERSNVSDTIILWMEWVAMVSITPLACYLLGVVVNVIFRLIWTIKFLNQGLTFAEAREFSGGMSKEDAAQYIGTDNHLVSFMRPPPNEKCQKRHNAWAQAYGWPQWQLVKGKWVVKEPPVKQEEVTHESMHAATIQETLIESTEQDLPRKDKQVLARMSKPQKIEVESGEQDLPRKDKQMLAKMSKPQKTVVESAEQIHSRRDRKLLASATKPKKIVVESSIGDMEITVEVESGKAQTVKFATPEQVMQTTKVVKEYLSGHQRSRYDIPNLKDVSRTPVPQEPDGPIQIDVEGCSDYNCVDVVRKVASKHTYWIKNKSGSFCACIVSGEYAFFPAHMAQLREEVVLYKHKIDPVVLDDKWAVGQVTARSPDWDLAIAKLDRKAKDIDNLFVRDHSFFSAGKMGMYFQYVPTIGSYVVVSGSYRTSVSVMENSPTGSERKEYVQRVMVSGLSARGTVTKPGDCGGVLGVMNPQSSRKLVGFHTSGSSVASFTTILTEDRIMQMRVLSGEVGVVEQHSSPSLITWAVRDDLNFNCSFLLEESSEEAQHFPGGCLDYVGDSSIVSKPVAEETGLKLSPFGLVFPEVLSRPSVLSEADPRLVNIDKLAKDRLGYPSILLTQMQKYSGPPVEVDEGVLESLVVQLTDHYSTELADEELGVPLNRERAEWEMVNGNPDDEHYKPLALKASAGFPWTEFGYSKKVQFLTPHTVLCEGRSVDGHWFDPHNPQSVLLYSVFRHKLDVARNGQRTHSVWKDCLKDELRPLEKIQVGKTRAFTAAPFESVLMMRFLFGRFKAAHTRAFLRLNHAVGVNPMSPQWNEIYQFLQTKGPTVLDGDFSSFDGTIPRQFMAAAGEVMIRVIEENSHDGWSTERRVLWQEIIDTMQVSWSTLYMKRRGNNSGQPLTTPTNCIALFLMMWYVFAKAVGTTDLAYFLEQVAFVDFGDDNVQNVAQEVQEDYNPQVIQSEFRKLGMEFTPATKEGEVRWQTLDEVVFLKRKFVPKTNGFVVAPLELTSIQQCFNYSLLEVNDCLGWKNLTHEQMLELSLHGNRTYVRIASVLKAAIKKPHFDKDLRSALAPELNKSFANAFEEVKERYGLSKREGRKTDSKD